MNRVAKCLLVLLFVALYGCAAPPSKATFNRIESVTVEESVEIPDEAVFLGVASNFKGMGLVGGAIAARDLTDAERLTRFLAENGIDFGALLRTAFLERLNQTAVSAKVRPDGAYRIKLRVKAYGLGKDWGFENRMRTTVNADVMLVDRSDKVIWKRAAFTGMSLEGRSVRTLEEWMAEPEAMRKEMAMTAAFIADQMLEGWNSGT